MFFVLLVLVVIGLIIFSSVQKARRKQREMVEVVRQAVPGLSSQPVTLKQGNVRVSVTTTAHADDPRFQPMADEIAKAFASFPETGLDVAGLSQRQAEVISEVLQENFGKTVPNLLRRVQETAGGAGDLTTAETQHPSEQQAASILGEQPSVFTRPTTPIAQPDTGGQDPFAAGNIFDRHKQEADATFSASSQPAEADAGRKDLNSDDPFRR